MKLRELPPRGVSWMDFFKTPLMVAADQTAMKPRRFAGNRLKKEETMKNWKTIGALLIIVLMALTGCPAPTEGDESPGVTHTVSFNVNGGSAVSSQEVTDGRHATEPTAPTRSGYVFYGWYADSGLTNAWDFAGDTVNRDTTLYGRWEIPPTTSIEKIFVQGGTFQMGNTDSEAYSDESPVHSVTVDSFYMAETEVTHEQFLEFLNDAGVSAAGQLNGNEVIDMDDSDVAFSHDGTEFSFAASGDADDIDCPVIEVTWYGAVEYSNWLSEQDGLSKAYSISGTSVTWNQSAKGYRLPTEAEWEYAARGGAQSNGYKYAGSNDVDEVGWYSGNSGSKTHPVKGKKANELGLYDMSGNVWEWCWDWYDSDYYSSSPESNPTGPSSGSGRVLRGGSWLSGGGSLRSAHRFSDSSGYSSSYLGFRPVLRTVTF